MCKWSGPQYSLETHLTECLFNQLRPIISHLQMEIKALKQDNDKLKNLLSKEQNNAVQTHNYAMQEIKSVQKQLLSTASTKDSLKAKLFNIGQQLTCRSNNMAKWSVNWAHHLFPKYTGTQNHLLASDLTTYFYGFLLCGEIPGEAQKNLMKYNTFSLIIPSYNASLDAKEYRCNVVYNANIPNNFRGAARIVLDSISNSSNYLPDCLILDNIIDGLHQFLINKKEKAICLKEHTKNWVNPDNTLFSSKDAAWKLLREKIQSFERHFLVADKCFLTFLQSKNLSKEAVVVIHQYLHSGGIKWLLALSDTSYNHYLRHEYMTSLNLAFNNKTKDISSAKLRVMNALSMIFANHILMYNWIHDYFLVNKQ